MHSSQPQSQSKPKSKPKSKLKGGIAIAVTAIPILVAGTLFATNPNEEAYGNYALETACEYSSLPQQVQAACKDTVGARDGLWGRDRLKSLIVSQTQRQNFALFSIYKTEVFGQTYTSIGALGTFFPVGVKGS
ncbi:MAG: DUF4359 domain-containing protein [Cyanobacteriota bacterium]|nr:DUF4359 domain-containing protein [Cyanobacteriota bacterium]